ncbi:D-2-hydroxyacid dehydrogenase family protein [Pseudomonas gozinkensis]|uniref:D-2-hydroxyacid dehydrogenase family protein n=1 Tax=Pseudomonas gozinkensis TaxID=2774461 RepID=UPI001787A1D2|nr:D-2-hydroxyacid dehydrogenase family protein [Pseudomonas gozinkensis]
MHLSLLCLDQFRREQVSKPQISRKKIAILNDYQGVALSMADWSALQKETEVVVFREPFANEREVIAALADFDVICVMRERTPLTREILRSLPKLRLIASTAQSNSSIDVKTASELGITIAWTEHLPYGTTELVWGLILSAIRRIPAEVQSFRTGGWQTSVGQDISGRTLGIVGLGNFGKAVARVGQAFDMRVIAWSPNLDPEMAKGLGVEAVSKQSLFEDSDIVTLHMVLSERTKNIVGSAELDCMKSHAWLINASRSGLVDQSALITALDMKQIAGAALDVYDEEPVPADHPYREMGNVIATPHIGFVTEDTYRLFYSQTVENIESWLKGMLVRETVAAG